jgi:hypothetical protein
MTPARHLNTDTVHIVIPDTQAKRFVPTKHLEWVGTYIGEKFAGRPNVKLIHLGDHWDMPSLSSYDRKGGKLMEGRRYKVDIATGNEAWQILNEAIILAAQAAGAPKRWFPEAHFLMGNHEDRIERASKDDAQLEGLITLDDLAVNHDKLWTPHEFLEPVWIDGIAYAHYFTARGTGRPLSGQSIDARIKTIGHSFTAGHQQGLWFGRREIIGGAHLGLVAGSCYLHDEEYLGAQGNKHWRGIVVCYDVHRGDYDPKFVSLGSLCKRYEGKTLAQFKGRH